MLQKTFPQTANLDKSRHPQSLNQIILNVNWDRLNRFGLIFIFIDTRHQRNHFEINSKSLSNLSFPEVNSIFGVAISKKDSSSVIFRNYFFDWFELFSNDWSSTFQMYRPTGINYATYRNCDRTLITQRLSLNPTR